MEIKRTEKLVSALYLLTSFFGDKEPMKWKLRQLGGELLAQKETQKFVLEIGSNLSVAKTAGLISETNFEIINREISKLSNEGNIQEILKLSEPKQEPRKEPVAKENLPIERHAVSPARPAIKDKKDNRQNTIINLLKKKKEIMIKDVSPLIDGVSEKTIQRELLSMVEAGILRKIGEKRWSRYTLAE